MAHTLTVLNFNVTGMEALYAQYLHREVWH